jgi:hypothetical protein
MAKIRWMFYFEEGSIQTETLVAEEDEKIRVMVRENPKGTLILPNTDMEIWVNLDKVKCITRQEIKEEVAEPVVEAC